MFYFFLSCKNTCKEHVFCCIKKNIHFLVCGTWSIECYIEGKRQKIIERRQKNINEVPCLFFCNVLLIQENGEGVTFSHLSHFYLNKCSMNISSTLVEQIRHCTNILIQWQNCHGFHLSWKLANTEEISKSFIWL